MKPFILTAVLLFCMSFYCFSQDTTVKLYGFRQSASPGAHPSGTIDEQGQEVLKQTKTYMNYFIYLTHAQTSRVYPMEMWIDGEQYGVKPETVETVPVEYTIDKGGSASEKITLVPKTTDGKVVRLIAVESIPGKMSLKETPLAKENELVVVYLKGGKTYTKTVKKMTVLTPAALQ